MKVTLVKKRLIYTYIIMALVVFAGIARVGYIQIVQGEGFKELAFSQQTRDALVPAKRGNILDRTGKKLAASITLYSVQCMPEHIKKENADEYSKIIADILEMDKSKVYEFLTSEMKYVNIKKWIEHDKADTLKKANLKGIFVYKDSKRTYPYDSLASQIIGNTDSEGNGGAGIEMVYNKYLTGIPGRSVKIISSKGVELPYTNSKIYDPIDGYDIVLTIDESIQHYIEDLAEETMRTHSAKNVSILVMNTNSGEILGMSSKPDYNPNNRTYLNYHPKKPWLRLSENDLVKINSLPWNEKSKSVYSNWTSPIINEPYDPGSTFKIITAASAIEENLVSQDETFICNGSVAVDGQVIKCWNYPKSHGEQSLYEVIQNSCNPALVEIGSRLNKERLYKYTTNFGFGKSTDIELTGEANGIVRHPDNMNNVDLATISFGQGITTTQLQLLTSISAFANDGKLMKPFIVKRIIDENDTVIESFEPEVVSKVVSKQTADTMLDILESVVTDGTGRNAYVKGFRVGGKSGTSQKLVNNTYGENYVSSFVSIAPINNPEIAVLVTIDEPKGEEYHGGVIAGPVSSKVVQHTLHILGIRPEYIE